jgi:divinyl protochlorophyllide a 8-vinyl-reductase
VAEAGAIGALPIADEGACPRVGPNAIVRVAEALTEMHGASVARAVFVRAGLPGWLDRPPAAMVPEADVAALHLALLAELGEPEARAVAAAAGRRTAAYLLANRIPAPARMLLRLLPAGPSARLLLRTIGRHAWTFCGSGSFAAEQGRLVVVTITGGPLRAAGPAAAGVAAYYAATFHALFCALVHPHTTVAALRRATEATASCAFALSWR